MPSNGFPGLIRLEGAGGLKHEDLGFLPPDFSVSSFKQSARIYTPPSYIDPEPLLLQPGNRSSGRSVARLSRLVWDQEVASSNLAAPT